MYYIWHKQGHTSRAIGKVITVAVAKHILTNQDRVRRRMPHATLPRVEGPFETRGEAKAALGIVLQYVEEKINENSR